VQGSGFMVLGLRVFKVFRCQGFGFRVSGSGFWVVDLRLRVYNSGNRIWESGFRV
jgi:hypothetical protein